MTDALVPSLDVAELERLPHGARIHAVGQACRRWRRLEVEAAWTFGRALRSLRDGSRRGEWGARKAGRARSRHRGGRAAGVGNGCGETWRVAAGTRCGRHPAAHGAAGYRAAPAGRRGAGAAGSRGAFAFAGAAHAPVRGGGRRQAAGAAQSGDRRGQAAPRRGGRTARAVASGAGRIPRRGGRPMITWPDIEAAAKRAGWKRIGREYRGAPCPSCGGGAKRSAWVQPLGDSWGGGCHASGCTGLAVARALIGPPPPRDPRGTLPGPAGGGNSSTEERGPRQSRNDAPDSHRSRRRVRTAAARSK